MSTNYGDYVKFVYVIDNAEEAYGYQFDHAIALDVHDLYAEATTIDGEAYYQYGYSLVVPNDDMYFYDSDDFIELLRRYQMEEAWKKKSKTEAKEQ